MKNNNLTITLSIFALLAGCSEEAPPHTVNEFRGNSNLLEAATVRCAENRSTMKYEAECVNAREAINLMARAEEEANREALEAQSERKRRALRRAQGAAAESRRRATEAERRRLEAEYLGQFASSPIESQAEFPRQVELSPIESGEEARAAMPADEPPAAVLEAEHQPSVDEPVPATGSDLDDIRRELERRNH